MQVDVLIVGGGISGLTAAWQLSQAGVNVKLLEARSRLGGRILTIEKESGADCDLGPSWFWPGQPLVAGLLQHFDIPSYEQYADGAVLYQQPDGRVIQIPNPSPMAGALRMEGGIQRLTDAIADEIDAANLFLNHAVTGLSVDDDGVIVNVVGPSGQLQIRAKQVAVAIPPRLAAMLTFEPALPAVVMQALAGTPTWMGGHAKFFAIYDEPFWRKKGLCGTAISRYGPLAEIHDASPHSGQAFCLFGFAGVDAATREEMGQDEFVKRATAQLASIFGEEANLPTATHLQDWSQEAFTASAADGQPPSHHPQYGLNLQLGDAWDGKLDFISTETSFSNGGLIEGAIEAGLRFAQRIVGLNKSA